MADGELEALARAVIAGEAGAETRLVARLAPSVRVIVRTALRARDWSAIDDISQDVLWEIVCRLRRDGLDDLTRIDHFVCRMARNRAVDLWRLHSRQVGGVPDDIDDEDPLSVVERADALRAAQVMIGAMRVERDRRLLIGVYFDGMSKEHLCRELGIESTHFDRVLFRARERLVGMLRATRQLQRETVHGYEHADTAL